MEVDDLVDGAIDFFLALADRLARAGMRDTAERLQLAEKCRSYATILIFANDQETERRRQLASVIAE